MGREERAGAEEGLKTMSTTTKTKKTKTTTTTTKKTKTTTTKTTKTKKTKTTKTTKTKKTETTTTKTRKTKITNGGEIREGRRRGGLEIKMNVGSNSRYTRININLLINCLEIWISVKSII